MRDLIQCIGHSALNIAAAGMVIVGGCAADSIIAYLHPTYMGF